MAFPTDKTNAVDNTTDVLASHLNNIEDKVGLDDSADADSLDYRVGIVEDAVYTWKGAWVTATAYVVNDTVEEDGSGYVCVEAHTSGTFSTDLTAGKWELFVEGLPTPNITTSTTTNLTGYLYGDGTDVEAKGTENGWIGAGETWTYASVDDPTGVLTVPSDATDKYSVGMKISLVNGGNTIYGIITVVTSTTITFLHEIDPTDSLALHLMANSAITIPRYSTQKAPFSFPLSPRSWTIEVRDSINGSQSSPTQNVWYNLGSGSITVPIGGWLLEYQVLALGVVASAKLITVYTTLSTANNTKGDDEFSMKFAGYANTEIDLTFQTHKYLTLTTKDVFYLNTMTDSTSLSSLYNLNTYSDSFIRAVCAYL